MNITAWLAAAAALLTIGCASPPPAHPPTSPDAPTFLTADQVRHRTASYLASVAWAEAATNAAAQHPEQLLQALMTNPPLHCAQQYQQQRPANPEQALPDLKNCISRQQSQPHPYAWFELDADRREARAHRAVRLLWESIDYRPLVAVGIAADTGMNILQMEDERYRAMTQAYGPCDERTVHWGQQLAEAPTPRLASQVWLNAEQSLNDCVNAATETLYPEAAPPTATPDHDPAEP